MESSPINITTDLLFRFCQKRCSSAEEIAIEKEMAISEELKKTVEDIRIVLALDEDIHEYESIDVKAAYQKVWKKATWKFRLKLSFMRYAAILALPFLLLNFVLGYICIKNMSEPVLYSEISTPHGAITRHELSDKTIVWLNAGSKLRYPTQFKEASRNVELEGEAYFEVTADKEHPFYVTTTSGVKMYAYGTKFNVNAYNEEDFLETVLEEGQLNVIFPEGQRTAVLKPSDKLYYNYRTGVMRKDKTSIYEKTAWKDGKLIFRDTPLKEILKRLARYYNVDISLENPRNKEYSYRATFTGESLTQILDYLSRTVKMKWTSNEPIQQSDSTLSRKRINVILY